jgi:phosphate transport system protein
MVTRSRFDNDLLDLQRRLLWLGEAVRKAVMSASWALLHHDAGSARHVVQGEAAIDGLRYGLEEYALRLIARNQPFAGDLRMISAYMGVAVELERIGDYAEGIGKIVLRSMGPPALAISPSLEEMSVRVREMLDQALRAVVERDAKAMVRLERSDDLIDRLYHHLLAELVAAMRRQPEQITAAIYLLWAAHDLERTADRTVNIAERAAFIATGALPRQRNGSQQDMETGTTRS